MHETLFQNSDSFVDKEAGKAIVRLREKLGLAYYKSNFKITNEVEALSQELDKHIIKEQNAKINASIQKRR